MEDLESERERIGFSSLRSFFFQFQVFGDLGMIQFFFARCESELEIGDWSGVS